MVEECKSDELKKHINAAGVVVMSATLAAISVFKSCIPKELSVNMDLARNAYIASLIHGSDIVCLKQLRMSKFAFHELCAILSERSLLKPTRFVPVTHQLAMFLHTIAHDVRNSTISSRFFRSGETVSRHFNSVLAAIITLRHEYIVQPRMRSMDKFVEKFDKLAEAVGDVASAIKSTSNDERAKYLYSEVLKTEGFDELLLEDAFDFLNDHENIARSFLAKGMVGRCRWLKKFESESEV